jgi:hypothetical protein
MSKTFTSNKAMRRRGALKHGAYSESVLLPGEDPREFKILHAELVAEFAPEGRLQQETVATIAALVWRRQNLKNFELAPLVTLVTNAVTNALLDDSQDKKLDAELSELSGIYESEAKEFEKTVKEAKESATKQKQAELYLLGASKIRALTLLLKECDVQDRIDSMIDRQVRRLCNLKALASVTQAESYPVVARPRAISEGNVIE